MDHWDVRLIGVTSYPKYEDFTGDLEMHLFGKTQDGVSLVAKFGGFEPYFYIVEPSDEVVAILEGDTKRVRRTEPCELLYQGEKRRCRKVVVTHPGRGAGYSSTLMAARMRWRASSSCAGQ